ncbi:ATP-binding cassette domain-containing protein [Gorillibacterium massiliense]|uniref:ATP-binding cassette domain-containing protein n=1 Tax=Gorillibacterium massiliense TaxID=1280390 RepID=UPI0004B8931F|nr:ATP-binding cassette domain-containing protein [Gorillibacterium massiliense]
MDRNQQKQEPLITMKDVSYAHKRGEAPFLRDINLTVSSGEWISIVGRNGSGKSTLVRLLNGLLPVSGGTITVDGIVLGADTLGQVRQRIGMIFANPDNQFVGLTVMDDVLFGLENLCLSREEIQERLDRYVVEMKVEGYLDRHPSQLSGGQKQRVAITSVLAMEPQIVIFDESTSMLDEKAKHELIGIIRDMQAAGRYTILSVTHDSDEMLASDRIIALADGTIVADAKPQDFFRSPDLLDLCRIEQPFLIQIGDRLHDRGLVPAGQYNEKELVEALWASASSTSTIPTTPKA